MEFPIYFHNQLHFWPIWMMWHIEKFFASCSIWWCIEDLSAKARLPCHQRQELSTMQQFRQERYVVEITRSRVFFTLISNPINYLMIKQQLSLFIRKAHFTYLSSRYCNFYWIESQSTDPWDSRASFLLYYHPRERVSWVHVLSANFFRLFFWSGESWSGPSSNGLRLLFPTFSCFL